MLPEAILVRNIQIHKERVRGTCREAEKQKSTKAEEAKSAEAGTVEYRAKTRLSST